MSVKHTLLALLYQRPMHGYELGKQFNLDEIRMKGQSSAEDIHSQLGKVAVR